MIIKETKDFDLFFLFTLDEDIILNDIVSEPVTSRGHIGLKKSDLKQVVTLMVVVYFNLIFFCLINVFLFKLFISAFFLDTYSDTK